MGNCSGKQTESDEKNLKRRHANHITTLQEQFKSECDIPLDVQVAFFTPSSFPMNPVINKRTCKLCTQSWKHIVESGDQGTGVMTTSGITLFYGEFYDRLALIDANGKFEAVLGRHATGANSIAAKGSIIIRIIKYVLAIEGDSEETQLMLYMLGKSHAQKQIRPWQYASFVEMLLLTISSRLGVKATSDVMEAWVNLFAFVMRSMLPPAIKGQVVENEINVNTSSEFSNAKVAKEINEIEEMRMQKKKGGSKFSDSKFSFNGSQYSSETHSRTDI